MTTYASIIIFREMILEYLVPRAIHEIDSTITSVGYVIIRDDVPISAPDLDAIFENISTRIRDNIAGYRIIRRPIFHTDAITPTFRNVVIWNRTIDRGRYKNAPVIPREVTIRDRAILRFPQINAIIIIHNGTIGDIDIFRFMDGYPPIFPICGIWIGSRVLNDAISDNQKFGEIQGFVK